MLRPWSFKLELDNNSHQPVYQQIVDKVTQEIRDGRLTTGSAMPGTRDLARTLRVNRKTVILAYDELIAQGWLVTEERRGTFVAEDFYNLPDCQLTLDSQPTMPVIYDAPFDRCSVTSEDVSRYASVIDFSDVASDNRLLPLEIFSRAYRKALLLTTRSNQPVNHPQGLPSLRGTIANMVNMEKNFRIDADSLCVLSNSQTAVFIIARLLTTQNDCIVFERLSNPMARQAFEACGASIAYVDVDSEGANVEQIEALVAERKIRAVYVTPQHQFPTSVTMSQERRERLLVLAQQHGFYIIEDDREHEFYFDSSLPFPIASMDQTNRTIYLASLSSVLSPAMEISYLIAEKPLIERCVAEKSLIEYQNKLPLEYAAYELIESGEMQRHRRKISKVFAERRSMMDKAISEELDGQVNYHLPKCGLAFWLMLRRPVDMAKFISESEKEMVRFSHGSQFSPEREEIMAIRLGFAKLNLKELRSGIRRIKKALVASMMSLMVLITEPTIH